MDLAGTRGGGTGPACDLLATDMRQPGTLNTPSICSS